MQVVRGSELVYVAASHEKPEQPGVLKKVLGTRTDFVEGRVQMLNWSLCPKHSSFRLHYHEDMQEIFVIINGTVEMEVENQKVILTAGDAVFVEPREVHKMTNICDQDVAYLVFGISTGKNGKTVVVEE
jgi:mannose-6-phosphate isomerase-like protein (cupin superfamily)